MKNKKGFTLIEVVISIALISILVLGIVELSVAVSSMLTAGNSHHEATNEYGSAIEEGLLPQGAVAIVKGTINLNLSNANEEEKPQACPDSTQITMKIEEKEMSYPEAPEKGKFTYYD